MLLAKQIAGFLSKTGKDDLYKVEKGVLVKVLLNKVVNTEVLAIGGGGAGVTAAIGAARKGAQVTLVSKGKVGNSGNTIMIGGSYAMDGHSAYYKFGIKEADKELTKDILFNQIVRDSFYLSEQDIVEQFVEESPDIIYEVKQWADQAGQKFIFRKPATWNMSGNAMGKALQHGLKQEDVEIIEDVIIVDLLKDGDKVCGAVGIDIYSGEIIQFNAKAVVMGTGGYQPFTLKNTNSDMTGDGVAMAFRAGAQLADMEFLLYLVTCLEPNEVKGSILPVFFVFNPNFKYRVTDANGDEIVIPKELKEIEVKSELGKLIELYYYGKCVLEGRGTEDDGVYFDFSDMSEDEIDDMFEDLIKSFLTEVYKDGFYHGDDVRAYKEFCKKHKRVKIGLGNEYTHGGIVINEKMESSIEGLYAAGECSSGAFGSNRVADAVVEMLVQGIRAGKSAAEYSKNKEVNPCNKMAQEIAKETLRYFENKKGISAVEANLEIERISDKGLSFFRTEEGLDQAIAEYQQLEEKMNNMVLKSKSRLYNYEWIQAIQAKNRLLCAKLSAIMAKERKESRGMHLRADYPLVDDDNFLIRHIAELRNGVINLSTKKPKVTKLEIPKGGKTEYIDYILNNEMGLENISYEEER